MPPTSCCNDTYIRHADGAWHYAWGPPVPEARDLSLHEALAARDPQNYVPGLPAPPATPEDVAWARSLCAISDPVVVHHPDGTRDLVIGLSAPELAAPLMVTVTEIAEIAEVSKATVDSYRYRGYLPEPQLVRGRTPLWARPVVHHWMENRPGAGWRTDVYGEREEFTPHRSLPITSARQARERPSRVEDATAERSRSA